MNKRILAFGIIAVLAVSFSSCKKRRLNRDTTTTIDASTIEGAFNDMQKVSEDAAKEENLEGQRGENGFAATYGNPTVTVTPAWPDPSFPKDIEIDFGTGTTDWLGITRKGILNVNVTGFYRDSGAVFTIVPSNFYVQNYKLEGIKVVSNKGRNTDGNMWYTISIANGKLTTPDGETVNWESQREREWIGGESTTWLSHGLSGITDDRYSITGTANGVNRLGRAFTINITKALVVALDCKWVREGTLELIPDGLDTRTVDYGNGACDNDATVTIRNRTYNIKMW